MIRNIWILIAKKLNGEATAEELQELDPLLADPDNDISVDALTELWQRTSTPAQQDSTELDEKWDRFNARLDIIDAAENIAGDTASTTKPGNGVIKQIIKYTAYAASVILVGSMVYWKLSAANTDPGITSVVAPANGASKILLPDGSSVWLNAGSKISYRNNSQSQCREVTLSGEAYFDVVKDTAHPFTVETPSFKIKVLGTAFNVRSYIHDQQAEATLVRGKIELTLTKDPEKKYFLKPSERFRINSPKATRQNRDAKLLLDQGSYSSIVLSKVEEHTIQGLPSETLWMKNKIDFDGTGLEEIALMMEHKYNVAFVFKNEEAKRLKFTGTFKNEAIDLAMKELQQTASFKYKLNGNQVTIY